MFVYIILVSNLFVFEYLLIRLGSFNRFDYVLGDYYLRFLLEEGDEESEEISVIKKS